MWVDTILLIIARGAFGVVLVPFFAILVSFFIFFYFLVQYVLMYFCYLGVNEYLVVTASIFISASAIAYLTIYIYRAFFKS